MFNDDALGAHESELDRMRGFYADNAAVFKLVSKREKLWKQWLDFESKAGDPSRLFNDRGGKLQKELKQRNSVSKELPKASYSSDTANKIRSAAYSAPDAGTYKTESVGPEFKLGHCSQTLTRTCTLWRLVSSM